MDSLSPGATIFLKSDVFNNNNNKVDSWKHEIELSIISNKNETRVFKEDVSKITQKHEDLVEEINALKTVVNENRELILENKKMREDLSNFKKTLEKNMKTKTIKDAGTSNNKTVTENTRGKHVRLSYQSSSFLLRSFSTLSLISLSLLHSTDGA